MFRRLALPVLAGLLSFAFLPAAAQDAPAGPLRGRVVNAGAPVAGVPVTLHRVSNDTSGVIAERLTDAAGRFQFQLPALDTTGFNVFFATAEFGTVRYFGPPLHPSDDRSAYVVEVYDTTSTLPGALRVARRDMVLLPQTDGSWEVNEVVRVRNTASKTLVSPDGMPTWEVRIPEQADAFEAGEGDLAPGQVQRMGERVLLLMPLLPGDREFFFRYRLPARTGEAHLALAAPADTVNVFVRQPSPRLVVTGLATTNVRVAEGERFLQFGATDLPPDSEIRLSWETSPLPVSPITAAVSLSLILLAAGTVVAFRDRSRPRGGTRA